MDVSEWVGWHFVAADRRLRWPLRRGEPRPVVQPGMTLRVEGPPVLCEWGLHASRRGLDALQYAPGPVVCRVRLGGEIVEGDDKAAATERTVLWMADATRTLHEFGLWCAEQALQRERAAGREPDPRSWKALEVKRRWLAGDAGDDELAAARAAARDAAWDTARDAARDAAWGEAVADAVAAARDGAVEVAGR